MKRFFVITLAVLGLLAIGQNESKAQGFSITFGGGPGYYGPYDNGYYYPGYYYYPDYYYRHYYYPNYYYNYHWRHHRWHHWGSVATLELRRTLAIAYAKLDRHRAEQAENEAEQKNSLSTQSTFVGLAFADHMDRLIAGDRTPSSPERAEALTGVDPALDCPVVLFQNVIQ